MSKRVTETDLHRQVATINAMTGDTLTLDFANGGVSLVRVISIGRQQDVLSRTRRPALYKQLHAMMIGIQIGRNL